MGSVFNCNCHEFLDAFFVISRSICNKMAESSHVANNFIPFTWVMVLIYKLDTGPGTPVDWC